MAVYYIDPYATINGIGTWALPYSFSDNLTARVSAGDELRVVAKYLTSLLTATTYTATRIAINQVTITSGGGLGADFTVNDYVYFPDYDAFAIVSAVSVNNVSFGGSSASIPVPNTSITSLNIRKLDTTVATPSTTSAVAYLLGASATTANITTTDGWVADGVRVTDGTAKSIVRSSATSGTLTFYMDSTSGSASYIAGQTADMANTHILGNLNINGFVAFTSITTATLSVNQVYSAVGNGTLVTGVTSAGLYSGYSYTFKSVNASLTYFGLVSMSNSTINITNMYVNTGFNAGFAMYGCTVNIGTLVASAFPAAGFSFNATAGTNATYNITTALDCYNNVSITAMTGQAGSYTINISGTAYINKRATTLTSVARGFGFSSAPLYSNINSISTPSVIMSGVTFSLPDNIGSQLFTVQTTVRSAPLNLPRQFYVYAGNDTSGAEPNWNLTPTNLLVTHANGSAPYELLGIPYAAIPSTTNLPGNNFPKVTLDAAVYRTAGPSIKVYLASYTSTYWTPTQPSIGKMSTKNIKIPVVSGTTYTISGYIRTNQTTFQNGHCIVALTDGFTTTNSQSMTTACINAWEQFTMTYTATKTQEINLAISMKFSAGAKAFWIDDITIV